MLKCCCQQMDGYARELRRMSNAKVVVNRWMDTLGS